MRQTRWGLLLAPGAGGSSTSSALLAVEEAAPPNMVIRRVDFPYRLAGKKFPDKEPVLVKTLVDEARKFSRDTRIPLKRIFLGGRSMGGRMTSIAVAQGLPTAGLVLISYPLHPPGKPEKLRTSHFPDVDVPVLFVSGTRDAFATPAELRKHARAIAGPRTYAWLEGGDHGLARFDLEGAAAVRRWLTRRTRQG